MQHLTKLVAKRIAWGVGVATTMFAGLGTVAALWENPLFMRMTPTGGFEITLLLLLSVLAGIYVGLPQTECGKRTAGTGGVIGFFGIACPVCNKILVLLFGGALLLEYYEPVRIYLALSGIALLAIAVWLKLTRRGCAEAGTTMDNIARLMRTMKRTMLDRIKSVWPQETRKALRGVNQKQGPQ